MQPKIWGSKLWYLIHLICFTFIKENQGHYNTFLQSLKSLIPCQKCRIGLTGELRRNKPNYNNLKQWSINLHNRVNKKLRKKNYSNQDVQKIYYTLIPADKTINGIQTSTLNINHNKIIQCLNLIVNNSTNAGKCKEFIRSLRYIYPDPVVRNKLEYVFTKGGESFNAIRNMKQMKNWFKGTYNKLGNEYNNISPSIFKN